MLARSLAYFVAVDVDLSTQSRVIEFATFGGGDDDEERDRLFCRFLSARLDPGRNISAAYLSNG